jgi:hypothetical protein
VVRPSYIWDARFLKVNARDQASSHTKEADLVLFLRDRFKIISPPKYKTLSIVVCVCIHFDRVSNDGKVYRSDAADGFCYLSLVRMLVALFLWTRYLRLFNKNK